MKNRVLSFSEAVQRRTEALKKSDQYSAQPAGNVIQFACNKPDGIKSGAKQGANEIKHAVLILPDIL